MRRLLRLPELVEIATRPEVIEHMIRELGPEMTRQALMVLLAKAQARRPDEVDRTDAEALKKAVERREARGVG
jgi:hypothetical protein